MTELILLLQADLDIQAAFERYENYQPGRGEVFMRQLDAAFTLLRQHPEIAPVYAGPYRRMLTREFPYGFFYPAVVSGYARCSSKPKEGLTVILIPL